MIGTGFIQGRLQPTIPQATRSDRDPFTATDWVLYGAVSVTWGSSFLLIKLGLQSLHPGLITWSRVGLGAIALLALGAAPLGVAMVLAATVCYGVATNLAGRLQRRYGSVQLMSLVLVLGVCGQRRSASSGSRDRIGGPCRCWRL